MPRFWRLSDWGSLLWLLAFLSVGAAFFAAYAVEQQRRTPFWEKYQQVRLGMTEEKVKSILGPPTDEETVSSIGPWSRIWVEGEQRIIVDFFPERDGDRVIKKGFLPKSLWEKLQDPANSSVMVHP